MIYSELYQKKSFRIPTFLALVIVIFVIVIFTKIFSSDPLSSKASSKVVKRIEITNLTSYQATIYWQTEKAENGWVVFGLSEDQTNTIANDDRDYSINKGSYKNHLVTLKNLSPGKKYYYKLVSGNTLVSRDGKPFNFMTPSDIPIPNKLSPGYGTIIKSNGFGLENAVVLIKITSGFPLSAITKEKGEWLIPLTSIYSLKSLKPKPLNSSEEVNIEVISDDGQVSYIKALAGKISPLSQTVIIGKDYNLLNEGNVLSAVDKFDNEEVKGNQQISILYPKENAIINGKIPLIKGYAIANEEVVITINSKEIFSTRVKADSDGLWQVLPNKTMSAGEYRISLLTKNKDGSTVTIERKFTMAKSGEQVLGEATPEPTLVTSPTLIPTATIALSPTVFSSPTPTNPVSGTNFNPLMFGSASLIIIGIGLALAF